MEQNIFNNTHSCVPFRRYKFRFKPTSEKSVIFMLFLLLHRRFVYKMNDFGWSLV
jgi:hypothetical protein